MHEHNPELLVWNELTACLPEKQRDKRQYSMNGRRLTVSLERDEAISVSRVPIGKNKLVYILVCDKKLQYPQGRSRIAYIGTTKKGLSRISQSVATRAESILSLKGVREFHARIVTCRARQHVKTWHKLERALLLVFRDLFGSVPVCNSHGKKMKHLDEFDYFSRDRLKTVIEDLS